MAVNRRLIVTSNGYQMATRRSRLKAWPEWAGAEYETALAAARRLRQDAQQALWLLRDSGTERLKRLLPQLAQHARAVNLAGLTVEARRAEHPGERWPRWAAQARAELLDIGGTAIYQAEAAARAWRRQDWVETERLLNACLAAGQILELLLLAGPPPKGVSVSDAELNL
jgi:hypothetical protein